MDVKSKYEGTKHLLYFTSFGILLNRDFGAAIAFDNFR
jgi:hypothetical protein